MPIGTQLAEPLDWKKTERFGEKVAFTGRCCGSRGYDTAQSAEFCVGVRATHCLRCDCWHPTLAKKWTSGIGSPSSFLASYWQSLWPHRRFSKTESLRLTWFAPWMGITPPTSSIWPFWNPLRATTGQNWWPNSAPTAVYRYSPRRAGASWVVNANKERVVSFCGRNGAQMKGSSEEVRAKHKQTVFCF